jgi:quercetin dioxygenase-like cupin family protein
MITIQRRAICLSAIALAVCLSPTVLATPGAGTLLNVVFNRATAPQPIHALGHSGRWTALLVTTNPTDFIIQNVQLAPGGYSGWHSHLGPVVLTVKQGTATMYRVEHGQCLRFDYPAGTAFVEPVGPHALQNESATEVLEAFNAHIIPAGAPQRVDEPDPGVCPGVL